MSIETPSRKHRAWLLLLAVAFTWLFFVPRYVPHLMYGLYQLAPQLSGPMNIIFFALYPFDLLFTRPGAYLALSFSGLVMVVAALVWGAPRWAGRLALLVGAVAIVAMPFAYRYEPAVWVERGYVMYVPTQPGVLGGVVKAMQVGAEVRRCEYNLLGWHATEAALYGEETCEDTRRTWVYRPGSDELTTVAAAPGDLVADLATMTGIHSTVPADALDIVLRRPVLMSFDGQWRAFVSRHIYGPEDVVVVSVRPSGE